MWHSRVRDIYRDCEIREIVEKRSDGCVQRPGGEWVSLGEIRVDGNAGVRNGRGR